MNFKKLLFIILLYVNHTAFSCDICGCFMGITPYDNQSQIAFLHRYRVFNGYREYHQTSKFFPSGAYSQVLSPTITAQSPNKNILPQIAHGDEHHGENNDSLLYTKTYSSKDFESFKVYELRLKYFLHKRIELNAIIPLINNRSKEDDLYREHTGIGDPTFFAGYHLVQKVEELKFQQRLITGLGFKLPSGNYYAKDASGKRMPFLMQPGTGSIDYFAYVNYILGYKKAGLSLNSIYKINGANYYHEKIGNSYSGYLNLFLKTKIKQLVLIPSAQIYYEYTKGLYVHSKLRKGTEMNVLLIGPGIDLYYKNIGLNFAVQFRGYEKAIEGNLKSAGRLVVGLSYNFNQSKYLLKKKAGN